MYIKIIKAFLRSSLCLEAFLSPFLPGEALLHGRLEEDTLDCNQEEVPGKEDAQAAFELASHEEDKRGAEVGNSSNLVEDGSQDEAYTHEVDVVPFLYVEDSSLEAVMEEYL